ncbi:MAG: SCP2 sterol-binding domain-containing protein [Actinomycetota bacterium]
MAQDAREILEQAVKGKSDDEIISFVNTMGGAEAVVDLTFEGMKAALNPDKAQDCIIGYEVTDGDKTHAYAVTIKDKQASYEKRDPTDARVTLGLALTDYLRLIAGDLDGMQAFMQGKLKLKGDMMFAQQVPQMFGL